MKKVILAVGALALSVFAFTSCLTVNAKKTVAAPYVPEDSGEGEIEAQIEKSALVYYSTTSVPEIDGDFKEWAGLEGVHARRVVYGGKFNSTNADGFFVCRTDGNNLYVYAKVTDNDPSENTYEIPQAWRGDGVEFFFGTETGNHTTFKDSDIRVRIAPRSKTDKFAVGVGLNDSEIKSSDIEVAVVYNNTGYQVEGKFPLDIFGGKTLKLNQKIRADFQVNDADKGKERTVLLHWNSPNDNTYADPSSWGNGKVVALPE
ncbi:MAG: sugar-binding protein [Spirochaetales bacterium]|nr:sugar-binding protein [Spirochaetales bacterium]